MIETGSVFFHSLLSVVLNFFLFLFAVFLAFYIPGAVLLKKSLGELQDFFAKIAICLVLGMVLWAYQGMIFGYLHLRFLSYIYLLVFLFLWVKYKMYGKLIFQRRLQKKWIPLVLVFLFGIFGQVQQFLITGFEFPDGIRIFTAASDDLFYHSSLISQLVRRFPPFEPGLVGVPVANYHYLSNLVIAELIRVFHLPLFPTQYIYMSVFLSFLLGMLAYGLAKALQFSTIGILFFVYIQYFSSDIIYLLTIITRRIFEFGVHPLEDGTMFYENPPRAFSIVVALGAATLLVYFLKRKNLKIGLLTGLLFGSLIGFKVHMGIVAIIGLIGLSLYFFIKKEWKMLLLPFTAFLVSALIYLPVNSKSGSLFYAPFEMAQMFVVQEKLNMSRLELARRIYHDHHNIFGEWRMNIIMLAIFLLGQFGIKLFGLIPLKAVIKKLSIPFSIFIYWAIFGAVFIGTFFLQPIAHGDTFNFYLAGSLFLSLLASYTLSLVFQKFNTSLRLFLFAFILLITIPRWIYKTQTVTGYFQKTSPAIHVSELAAMESLRMKTNDNTIVLVFNQGQWDSLFPYVTTFTGRDTFLSGQGILGRHSIPFEKRTAMVQTILTSKNKTEVQNILQTNKISILYFYGNPLLPDGLKELSIDKIFQNESNTIYQYKDNNQKAL